MLNNKIKTMGFLFNKEETEEELKTICQWWIDNIITADAYTFVGEVSHEGDVNLEANKGVILTTRMLWFFSEAAKALENTDKLLCKKLQTAANLMFKFICNYFLDKDYGGVFWEVDCYGHLVNDRKQVYAQSFAIYAFSAYYKLTNSQQALDHALAIFNYLEQYSLDKEKGGYLEAFSREWGTLEDVRLSDKDLNSPKTMNTHLHVLEAYTALYRVMRNEPIQLALTRLLACYVERFYRSEQGHFKMFQSDNWDDESTHISYGHDIESSWLIWEAAEVLGDTTLLQRYRPIVLELATVCMETGLNSDGSIMDLHELATKKDIPERVWWVQAEAVVGFLNAYQMTADKRFMTTAYATWDFIKNQIIDKDGGEWHAIAEKDQHAGYKEYKVGFWKGPYHNGRALLEICRRMSGH